jgi:hypothetical protein
VLVIPAESSGTRTVSDLVTIWKIEKHWKPLPEYFDAQSSQNAALEHVAETMVNVRSLP